MAATTRPDARSPRFRRDPFVPDGVFDLGGASKRFDERSGHPRTRCNTATGFDLVVQIKRLVLGLEAPSRP
jgi:hypothetical protein